MKKLGLLTLAAVLGSTLTFAVIILSGVGLDKDGDVIKIEHINKPYGQGAVLTVDSTGDIVPLDFRETANKTMKAVVHIKSTQTFNNGIAKQYNYQTLPDPFERFFGDDFFNDFFGGPRGFQYRTPQNSGPQVQVGTGSGVIINENGYIVTNNHVIDKADDIEVTLHDNRTYKATVVGTDPSTDLALIQINESGLSTIPMVNSDNVGIGEWVLAVGNPFNLNSTVTAGIVSAKGRNINVLKDEKAIESFIQTDAAINPGNSGGALVNLDGGLVGINTAIASPTGSYAGYGFAVPSNIVNKVVEDLLKYGVVQRGYLGVMIRGVDGNLSNEKELAVTSGVYVDSLLENSAGKEAGIRKGDVILKVDGQEVNTAPQLQELIGRKRPGDEVILMINRNGAEKELKVTLHNRNGEASVVEKERTEILAVLGADFEELDKKVKKKLNIAGGVKVSKLYPGKLRKHTEIKEGFIITKVDGQVVNSVDDLISILEKKKGGVMLEGVYEQYPGTHYYAFGL